MAFQSIFRIFRKKCTHCAKGRLILVNWFLASCVDENGKRYPDSWSYFECDRCGIRLQIYQNGRIKTPSEAEWSSIDKRSG